MMEADSNSSPLLSFKKEGEGGEMYQTIEVTDRLKKFTKDDCLVKVLSYVDLKADVVERFINLAKGINKNVVVVDWTSETIMNDLQNGEHNYLNDHQHYFIVYIPNLQKDMKMEREEVAMSVAGNMINLTSLSRQFGSFADEWHLFDKIPENGLNSEDGVRFANATKNYVRIFR